MGEGAAMKRLARRVRRRRMDGVEQGIWQRPGMPEGSERVVVVGGMHGDERMGAAVVAELQDGDNPIWTTADAVRADVILGSPAALEAGTRGTAPGRDLNRMFGPDEEPLSGDFESRRAAYLRGFVEGTSRLLDLHQTHCDTPPLAVIAYTREHLLLTSRLGLEFAVVGTDRVYGPCMLADLVNRRGGIGITVETGRADSEEALEVGRDIARRFLTLSSLPLETLQPVRVLELEESVPCPGPGLRFLRPLGNTSRLEAGEVWAEWDGGELRAPRDVVVLLPHEDVDPGRPCILFAADRGLFRPDAAR